MTDLIFVFFSYSKRKEPNFWNSGGKFKKTEGRFNLMRVVGIILCVIAFILFSIRFDALGHLLIVVGILLIILRSDPPKL